MVDLSPLIPDGSWRGFAPPRPPEALHSAFQAAWALNFYSPHYVTSRAMFDRTRIQTAGSWYDVLGTAELLRGLSRDEQDALVVRHAQHVLTRYGRAVPSANSLAIDFQL